jgi:hypothetical protein
MANNSIRVAVSDPISAVKVSVNSQNPQRVRNIQYVSPVAGLQPAFDKANIAFDYATASYNKANTAFDAASQIAPAYNQANGAYATANAAFAVANNVFPQIQPAFNQANAAYAHANASYTTANGASTLAQVSFDTANSVSIGANSYTNAANASLKLYVDARDSLLNEFTQIVYNSSNSKLSLSGGTINGDLNVTGQANVIQRMSVGLSGYTILPNLIAQFTGNSDHYSQINQQNLSGNGSGDIVVTTNNGSDTVNYIDMGIAGNTYNTQSFNAFSFINPNDGYVTLIGNPGQNFGGNLFIGTSGSNGSFSGIGDIVFIQGDSLSEVGRWKIREGLVIKTGTTSTSNSSGALVVQGGIGANGAIRGDALYDSGTRVINVAQAAYDNVNTSITNTNSYITSNVISLRNEIASNLTSFNASISANAASANSVINTRVSANVATLRGEITANAASANSVINTRVSANVATLRGEITANAASANAVINSNISSNVSTLRAEISSNVSTLRSEISANAASANSVINTNISANVATLRSEISANAASANSVINTNISSNVATLRSEISSNVSTLRSEITANAASANAVINSNISSNVSTLRSEISANAASANSVINTNISANVATLRGEIAANAVSANSVINTNISANVATLRGEINSNILSVFGQANASYATANAAYAAANTKFSSSGGTITGTVYITEDLSVTGNLIIGGNTTSISANDLVINDSIIFLANNNTSNILDLGLVGHFTTTYLQHSGVVRDHDDGTWKFFSNVVPNPTTTVIFDANTIYDKIKVGGIDTPFANINGTDILVYSTSAYSTVNTSITNTNSYITSNVAALRSEISTNNTTTYNHANAAYAQANTANNGLTTKFDKTGGAITGAITATGDVKGFSLESTQSVGLEGGELRLSTATAGNTTLSGTTITVDIYGDKLRFFETGGTNRGAFINLASATASVGFDLLAPTGGSGTVDQYARNTANAAFDKANTGGASVDQYARDTANASFANGNTTITNTNSYISSNIATLRGEISSNVSTINGSITANAASANAVINSNISANVATLRSEISANAASANSVINTNISANVSTLRSEITANAASANAVINSNISANVTTLRSEITANAASANAVINTNISANVATLRSEIASNTANAFEQANAAYAYANSIAANGIVNTLSTGSATRIALSGSTGNVTVDLATVSTITAGTYAYPLLNLDAYGRIVQISNQLPVIYIVPGTGISANANSGIVQISANLIDSISNTSTTYAPVANSVNTLRIQTDASISSNVSSLRSEITANAVSANSVINSRILANISSVFAQANAAYAHANAAYAQANTGGGGGGGVGSSTSDLDFKTYTATAGQTNFDVDYTVPFVNVYVNGVLLSDADYTASSGNNVVLATGCSANDIVNLFGFTSLEIIPSQTGNSGKFLTTNGTNVSWAPVSNGTVTSVSANVPSFLSISGSPITSSGTLEIGLSGTALPTTSGGTGNTSLSEASIVTYSGTETLTNKRITPRVVSNTSTSTLTPNIESGDIFVITALDVNLSIEAPTGSPQDGDKIIIRILDNGSTRNLTWNIAYTPMGITLPASTTPSKTTYVGCIYNTNNTRWDVIAATTQA